MRSGGAPRAPRCITAHLRTEVPSSPDPFALKPRVLTFFFPPLFPRDRITVPMLKKR